MRGTRADAVARFDAAGAASVVDTADRAGSSLHI